MTVGSLTHIKEKLENVINYEFGEWNSAIVYPYWVGEYNEQGATNEDGMTETTFILTGTTKGALVDLERDKEKIKKELHNHTAILPGGNGVAVYFTSALIVPVDDLEFKRMQINMTIKEWEV